mmetsp:Transcript_34142/g.105035  ORF Transcript_34142/g.105035 Transcript_34142/m.105035 type:complete len:543 (-) Transcript_34142:61-1689(-)
MGCGVGPSGLRRLALAAALVAGAAADADLEAKLADLEQQFKANHAEIEALEVAQVAKAAEARRLSTLPASIYGASNTTRAYTVEESLMGALTHIWLILCGALVMFMQAGFAMLEAGTCRRKFVQNILLKNLTDVAVGTLGWWIFGWSFAYSGPYTDDGLLKNKFAGKDSFAGHHFATEMSDGQQEPTTNELNWFFQWAFASAAATIVSGGVAERVKFPGYVVYSFLLTSFIYPIVVAWTWGYGWLNDINAAGYMDFAGSGIVHMTGGVGALVGAIIAGPRNGRFDKREKDETDPFAPHSIPLMVLGTFILWFGWYGFNCGSTLAMTGIEDGFKAAQVAMNTTIAASVAGLLVFLLRFAILRLYDVTAFCNGVLAGLVSITAPCGNVECGSALAIGIVGALLYEGTSQLLKKVKIDDPLDAFPVHGACGAWGVFAAALFDWGKSFKTVHAWQAFRCIRDENDVNCAGLADGLGKKLIAANCLEILSIVGWVGGLSVVIFLPLKLLKFLVATPDEQDAGFDVKKHSPPRGYSIEEEAAEEQTNA